MISRFGECIRIKNRLILTQFASKLNLHAANLSKIENNKRKFDYERLLIISQIFAISTKEIRHEYLIDQIAKRFIYLIGQANN